MQSVLFINQRKQDVVVSLVFKLCYLLKSYVRMLKIYVYGSDVDTQFDFDVENLHIIPITECNELYNKCKVGLFVFLLPIRLEFHLR